MTSYFATAPGRVNLIGEHTDYNGGFVLPMAIPQQTRVELFPVGGSHVRVESLSFSGNQSTYEYDLGHEAKYGGWADYIQGVTKILTSEGFAIQGFDSKIESHIPIGSGLSSSAALEVSLMKALRSAFNLSLDDLKIALLGQKVENDFVGAKVGIMDQMASSLAHPGQALFIDTNDLSYRQIRIPLDHMDLLVISSGVVHSNVHGAGYNERRSECEAICRILTIRLLRDLNMNHLPMLKDRLPEVLFRRARHVITENNRVLLAVNALEQCDIQTLGKLFYESHDSMKNDYEVSIPEIDLLINLAKQERGVIGARLTGGGFGGSVVILTEVGKSKTIGEKLCHKYHEETGIVPQVMVPENLASEGLRPSA